MRKGVFFLCSLVGLLAGSAVVLVTVDPKGTHVRVAKAATSDTYRQLNLFGDTYERVRSDFWEKPDDTKLVQDAIKGMLRSLEGSEYTPPEAPADQKPPPGEQRVGVGVSLQMVSGQLTVSPIAGSPAENGPLCDGDIITRVDGVPLLGLSLDAALAKIQGPPESTVPLLVERKGTDKPFEVVTKRQQFSRPAVQFRIHGKDLGYIRIISLSEQATHGVKQAIATLQSRLGDKLAGYIIDLRGNTGGLLQDAFAMADSFLDSGVIAEMRGRDVSEGTRRNATPGDVAGGKPIALLVDRTTASGAEIVAGALQSNKRAQVVGVRSAGSGRVQTIIPLGKGNGTLRLTTALFYTPAGLAIHRYGITPDVVVETPPPKPSATGASLCNGGSDAVLLRAAEILKQKG